MGKEGWDDVSSLSQTLDPHPDTGRGLGDKRDFTSGVEGRGTLPRRADETAAERQKSEGRNAVGGGWCFHSALPTHHSPFT